MNFISNLFGKVKEAVSPVMPDLVGLLGQEMYNCVGGHHYPNIVAYVGFVGVMNYFDFLKRHGIDSRTLWKILNKKNVSPFKRVPLLPYRGPGMPPLILERWGRLVWNIEDIYGEERDEHGNVILPTASQKSNLKRGRTEELAGGSQSSLRGIRRVDFCIKEDHPWEQQPPYPRPQIEELRAQWIEEQEEEWEQEEIELLLRGDIEDEDEEEETSHV